MRLRAWLPAVLASSVALGAQSLRAQGPPQSHVAPRPGTLAVTLLGTGTPIPRPDRFGAAILVEAGGQRLLFDAGRGVPIRLAQVHVPIGSLSAVFITHLHSDHVNGFPDLWLTGWLANPQFAHRTRPMVVYGPHGTRNMIDGLRMAYSEDIRIREADEKLPPAGAEIDVHEIDEGVVYDSAGVRVTAFTVDHGDVIKPAFGFRIDYAGHGVVLSGDTRPTENLVRFAKGADLLIHEVAMGRIAGDSAYSAALRRAAPRARPSHVTRGGRAHLHERRAEAGRLLAHRPVVVRPRRSAAECRRPRRGDAHHLQRAARGGRRPHAFRRRRLGDCSTTHGDVVAVRVHGAATPRRDPCRGSRR
ncbi:MAG TPA: MBL fold metallo-hydrolase [Gemmatimonadaceae bacterium]